MKTFFKDILSEEKWLIYENGFSPSKLNGYETLFTLGNGYMGSRGVLEEIPYDSSPGTYIAGVYDKSIAQVTELVNVPNPVDLRIIAEGEKIDVRGMYLVKHQRILDMKKAILLRHTLLANSRRERFDYKSMRFISSSDRHLGGMRIYITPLDAPILLTIQDNINVSVRNRGVLTEGRKKHFQISEVRNEKGINYLCAKTQDSGISIAYATHLTASYDGSYYPAPDQSFDIRLKKGETLILTKLFYIRTSRHLSLRRLRDTSIKLLKKKIRAGFDRLLSRHIACFVNLWKTTDIVIKGDTDADKSLRFNIYHMLITGNAYDDNVSIGARTLSGEGYRGHIFWDTEIFLLPFYIYNFPDIARNLLMYRYHRLDAAREIATSRGFKGALFAWESADSGCDETPEWHKDLDGSIIKIYTQDYEHHIVSDIAYAVYHYYKATSDQKFMNKYGSEILFETARFWASRVSKNKNKNRFEILNVMGPDEFHIRVNNNAFTNAMAKWNLVTACKFFYLLKERYPKTLSLLSKKIKLRDTEPKRWRYIAERVYIPFSKKRRLIEAHDGYFRKKDIEVTRFDRYFMPEFPKDITLPKLKKTQLVKQLDAVMLLYLLPDMFDEEITKNTMVYYEKRTVHKSSLSPAIAAIMNLKVGNTVRAYQYFLYALNADLKMHQTNVSEGIHAGSLGGCWQTVINGFGGFSIKGEYPSFTPQLPDYWESLDFSINWRRSVIRVHMTHDRLDLCLKPLKDKRPVKVKVYGKLYEIPPGKRVTVKRG